MSERAAEPIAKASFQMIITVHSMNLHRISELSDADHPDVKMLRVDGGLSLQKGPARAFIPDGAIAVLEYK